MPELPFSTAEFLAVFGEYNRNVWPAQWLLGAAAVWIVALLILRRPAAYARWIYLTIAGLWAWMAVAYHLLHFAGINPLAYGFAGVFGVEAALLASAGLRRVPPALDARSRLRRVASASLIAYALVVYPALGLLVGHAYPETPTFGVPCPTTILTIGVLCLGRGREVRVLLAIPILWSGVGGSAAFLLGIGQDLGLLAAGAVAVGAALGLPRGGVRQAGRR